VNKVNLLSKGTQLQDFFTPAIKFKVKKATINFLIRCMSFFKGESCALELAT